MTAKTESEWFWNFIAECFSQSAEASPKSGQGDIQIEQAMGFLLREDKPFTLIDYGCGKGRLLDGLRSLPEMIQTNIAYIGVSKDNLEQASEKCAGAALDCKFLRADEFDDNFISAKYIFLINVLHEVPLSELPKRLYHLIECLSEGGWMFIHDFYELRPHELNFVTWDNEDVKHLFDQDNYLVLSRPLHLSKTGIPLTTAAILKRSAGQITEAELDHLCLQMYKLKKRRLMAELKTLESVEEPTDSQLKRIGYIKILYANVDKQLQDKIEQDDITRREDRALTQATNPYDFQKPVVGPRFFGREYELDLLRNSIRENRSVAVFGLQRIGKTSLVKHALELEPQLLDSRLLISFDMFEHCTSLVSIKDFMKLIANLVSAYVKRDNVTLDADLSEILDAFFKYDERELVHSFGSFFLSRCLSLLKKERLLLFIDEFQDVEQAFTVARSSKAQYPFDASLMRMLSTLCKRDLVQLLVCGRFNLTDIDAQYNFQLLKLMRPISLGVMGNVAAVRLITEPTSGLIAYDDEAKSEILFQTGSHPYLIQYVCSELFEEAKAHSRSRVTREEVRRKCLAMSAEAVREPQFSVLYSDFNALMDGLPMKLLWLLAQVGTNPRSKVSCKEILSRCKDELGVEESPATVRSALHRIKQAGIIDIERRHKDFFYTITPVMLWRWIRRHVQV